MNMQIKWQENVRTDELQKHVELFRINQLSNSVLSLCKNNDSVSEDKKKKTSIIFSKKIIELWKRFICTYSTHLFSSSVTLLESAAPVPMGGFFVIPWACSSPSGNIPKKHNLKWLFWWSLQRFKWCRWNGKTDIVLNPDLDLVIVRLFCCIYSNPFS